MEARWTNENRLYSSFQKRSKDAFDKLYRQHCEAIYFFIYQLTGNKEIAEDITAETFVKLWNRWDELDDLSGIKAYLYKTARNLVIDKQRRLKVVKKREEGFIYHSSLEEETTILQAMTRIEFMQEIYLAIDKLPEQCAKIIKMIFVEGRSYDEIASDLNLSIHTIYNHRQRGITMLRKLLRLSVIFIFFSTPWLI